MMAQSGPAFGEQSKFLSPADSFQIWSISQKKSFFAVIFDPQSWYADSELELGSELPESFRRGYRKVIPEPRDHEERQKVYDFMVALIYCTCVTGEEFTKCKEQAVDLSKDISKLGNLLN